MQNIFIPRKINVGFNNRTDTYTGKLAYIIYYDQEGTLRKERSWNSWKDDNIPNEEFDNIPTSGFVLNKKAGGYRSHWNVRNTYTRVYDPRGFEFEITIPNLLFILENTDCLKGKGLEGEFVYGWDGTELILLPINAPDFSKYKEYSDLLFNTRVFKGKDLIKGATYKTKQNEELVYLGRFDFHEIERFAFYGKKKGKRYYFYNLESSSFVFVNLLKGKIVGIKSEECVYNFAELVEELQDVEEYDPVDSSKDKFIEVNISEFSPNKQITLFIFDGNKYIPLNLYKGKLSTCHYWPHTSPYVRYLSYHGEDDLKRRLNANKPENYRLYKLIRTSITGRERIYE